MADGYTRQAAADIVTGAEILAAPLNNEFNAVEDAFDGTSGHIHSGGSGQGPKIPLASSVTGTLPAANGGTGETSIDDFKTTLNINTGSTLQITSIELGHATDTSITRSAAGTIAVEGSDVLMDSDVGSAVQAYNANLTTWQGKTAPSGVVIGTTDTQTLTNKRITPRVGSTTSSATPSIDTDSYDIYRITALAVAITDITFTGTPTHGQKIILEITGTATRSLTPGSSVENSSIAFPTTTNGTNMLMIGLSYNSATSKWRTIAVA